MITERFLKIFAVSVAEKSKLSILLKANIFFFTPDKRELHFHPGRKRVYRFVEPERTDPIDPGAEIHYCNFQAD